MKNKLICSILSLAFAACGNVQNVEPKHPTSKLIANKRDVPINISDPLFEMKLPNNWFYHSYDVDTQNLAPDAEMLTLLVGASGELDANDTVMFVVMASHHPFDNYYKHVAIELKAISSDETSYKTSEFRMNNHPVSFTSYIISDKYNVRTLALSIDDTALQFTCYAEKNVEFNTLKDQCMSVFETIQFKH